MCDLLGGNPAPQALGRAATASRRRSPETAAEGLDAQTIVVPVQAVTGRVITEVVAEFDRALERRKRLEAEIEALFRARPRAHSRDASGHRPADGVEDPR